MKILIVDDLHPTVIAALKDAGHDVTYLPDITRSQIIENLHLYEGMLVRSKTFIDAEILDKGPILKFIGRAGAGLDQIDIEEVRSRGIELINAPEGNRDALAEHCLGMTLALLNHMQRADKEVREGVWQREKNRGYELGGLTVALIGYGFMGKATAKRFSAMGCRVLAYDKYLQDYGDDFAQEASMDQIRREADVLSLHLPLTEETKFMVDRDYLNEFQRDIWLINTARGKNLQLRSALDLLEEGKIKGMALDVLENENLQKLTHQEKATFDRLVQKENVILSPHVGGWTFESHVKINDTLVSKIAFLEG